MKKTNVNEFPLDELTRFYKLIHIGNAAIKVVDINEPKSVTWIQYSIRLWSKLLTHGKSMCLLSSETIFDSEQDREETNEFYDLAGIFSNARFQIDCYSTIYHFYFANIDTEIKRLRFDLWRYDSISTLQKIRSKEVFDDDVELRHLKECIHANEYFRSLSHKLRSLLLNEQKGVANWKFDPFKLETKNDAGCTWKNMFSSTGIKNEFLESAYTYLSDHVHSGYLSVDMLHNMTKNESYKHKEFAILLASFVQSFAIDDFATRFAEIREYVQELSELDRETILSFLKFGRNENWTSGVKYKEC